MRTMDSLETLRDENDKHFVKSEFMVLVESNSLHGSIDVESTSLHGSIDVELRTYTGGVELGTLRAPYFSDYAFKYSWVSASLYRNIEYMFLYSPNLGEGCSLIQQGPEQHSHETMEMYSTSITVFFGTSQRSPAR